MADINIFIVEVREARKRMKGLLPPQVRKSLDQAGLEIDMESNEELREKLPAGFPSKFTVPEQILFFPPEEEEPEATKKRRRQMRELNNRLRRMKVAGNR